MLNLVRMPTRAELIKLSHSELNVCIKFAFYQWQVARLLETDTAESERIYHMYDYEQLKRLDRFEKRLLRRAP
jgi:hypothetical protein